MSAWLIGVVTVIYCAVAVSFYLEGRPQMAIAFAGYALANIGFIWEALR